MCLISIIFFAYQWILGFCLLSFVGFFSAWQLNLLVVGRFLPKAKTKKKKFGKGLSLPTFDVHTWREGNIKLFDDVNVLFKLGFILSRNPFFMLSGLKEIHLILFAFGAISLCVDPTCRRSESLSLAVRIE
jgi:hypothetical protein